MRGRRFTFLLPLAGLALFSGFADSSAPSRATGDVDHPTSGDNMAAAATHVKSAPTVDLSLDEAPDIPSPYAGQRSNEIRRFPPQFPLPAPAVVARRVFERLPALNHVAAAEPHPYAIDLSERQVYEQQEPVRTPRTVPLVPSIVKILTETEKVPESVVPKKRVVQAKPPMPPLTKPFAAAPSGSAKWLMTGISLTAASQRADSMISHGFLLAEKGAYYSAKTEFEQALRTVSRALEAHFGDNEYRKSLAAGLLALEESGDFSTHSRRDPVVDVGLIVESHRTPVLQEYALDDVSPLLAMQHYFAFAEEKLVEACGRAPVASRALFGLGKIHMVLGEKSASAERLHGPKAMAFHQAALTTDPRNFLAANELGVLLARFGKLHEARSALQHSVALRPLPETWQNLSVVHQRLGEADLAAQSLANWHVASRQMGGPSSKQAGVGSMVQWVSPRAFVGQQPGGRGTSPMTEPVSPREQSAHAKQKSGFLWW